MPKKVNLEIWGKQKGRKIRFITFKFPEWFNKICCRNEQHALFAN